MASHPDKRTLSQVTADLARRWASQRLGAVQAYGRILADYSAGRSSGAAAAGAYAKLVAEEGVRYPADAVAIATDFAAAVIRQAGGKVASGSPGQPVVRDLDMSGPLGGEASAELLLRNPHDQPATLSFAATPFVGAAGDTVATVSVEPAGLVLQPGDERPITLRAALDPGVFEAGARYTANLAISGFDDLLVRVRLSVLPG
jgi:hypothetical protein